MAHPALEHALSQVPFLSTLGVRVEEARPAHVVLRLPALDGNRNAAGAVYGAALFTVGELAATVAAATHPDLHELHHALVGSRIRYFATATGDVTAHADLTEELLAAVQAGLERRGEARAEIVVRLLDGYGADLAEVVSTLSLSR